MDKILQANLRRATSYGNLYDVIEICYGIRLETAQKSHLLNTLQQGEHGNFPSLYNFIVLYLQEMGYKSKQLDDELLGISRNINYLARVLVK
ncbi:hypothetical protein J4429_02085 [Candidatus Pacearchaeota archaeon]|nr:hypothetical protein [Candidatus Pacearchaeota archaeon]